jgi:hypothetical protein
MPLSADDEMQMELSAPVVAALEPAIVRIESLVAESLSLSGNP